jgi:flagellar protein FliO/FliZ
MSAYASYIVETFVTLLAVCGIAFVVLYGARRLGVGRPRGPVLLVGHLPLEARRSVYLVKVGTQVIVVGASEAGLVRLGEVAPGELAEGGEGTGTASAPFADVLAKVLGGRAAGARPRDEEPRA